jgi:hypothetical protein
MFFWSCWFPSLLPRWGFWLDALLDIALESQHHPCFRRSIRSARFVDCSFLLEAMSSVSQRVTSNQALQPTANRQENLRMTTSTLKFGAQLALVSGG